MSDRPVPVPPTPGRVQLDPKLSSSFDSSSSSLWDRITTWAAEHKAIVYTIAGVTIVATAAGVYYYSVDASSAQQRTSGDAASKKKAKKDRRKQKKEGEEAEKKVVEEAGMFDLSCDMGKQHY
jgi:mitochondrial import receptor subunit TOM70